MEMSAIILSILGLCVFEIVSSIDNAVVNADVLSTMSAKWRKWFLVWGIFIGVFMVRGLLPWIIVWCANPALGPWGAFMASFSNDPRVGKTLRVHDVVVDEQKLKVMDDPEQVVVAIAAPRSEEEEEAAEAADAAAAAAGPEVLSEKKDEEGAEGASEKGKEAPEKKEKK